MSVEKLKRSNVLLSEKEKLCFLAAKKWHRKALTRRLFLLPIASLIKPYQKIRWATNPVGRILQLLVIALITIAVLPVLFLFIVLRKLWDFLLFPFLYTASIKTPASLKAPGERTLSGLHHAFSPHVNLGLKEYISCFREWISILYGDEAADRKDVRQPLEGLYSRSIANSESSWSPSSRQVMSTIREKISRKLGHY